MTKILYKRIENCYDCPFYNYSEGDCGPDYAQCHHPEAQTEYIIGQTFRTHNFKVMSKESNYLEEWKGEIPKFCPLKDELEFNQDANKLYLNRTGSFNTIETPTPNFMCGCSSPLSKPDCFCNSEEYRLRLEEINKQMKNTSNKND